MSFEIRMPKLSDNMEEGTVIRWIVDKGQAVKAGDPIAEVETDKADVEIEAEESGVVSEIVVKEGGVAAVGDVIAVLGDGAAGGKGDKPSADADQGAAADAEAAAEKSGDGAAAGAARGARPERGEAAGSEGEAASERKAAAASASGGAAPRRGASGAAAEPQRASRGSGGDVLASPVARELAEQRGVDLSDVRGSGPGGRIVKADVEKAASAGTPAAAKPPARSAKQPGADDAKQPAAEEESAPPAAESGETMSRMRRTIAARMEKSKREIPHFYARTEVDVGDLMRLYESIRADELVPGLTVTHLLLRAIAVVMPHHRRLNALWVDDSIQLVDDVNIGVVVALDDGLLVPVVKRAQDLGLRDLVEQTRALVDRTRKGRFRSDDLTGGTISVSNIGMLDVDELTPVINPPQASIIGVGAVRDRALVRDGNLVAGRVMTLTIACDHRIVHGVEAGRFLEDLKHALERPLGLVALA